MDDLPLVLPSLGNIVHVDMYMKVNVYTLSIV